MTGRPSARMAMVKWPRLSLAYMYLKKSPSASSLSLPSSGFATRGVVQAASAQAITNMAPVLESARAATGRSSAPTTSARTSSS